MKLGTTKTEHKSGTLKQTNKRHKGNSKRDNVRSAGPGKVNKEKFNNKPAMFLLFNVYLQYYAIIHYFLLK
jgi:hypothetical protein